MTYAIDDSSLTEQRFLFPYDDFLVGMQIKFRLTYTNQICYDYKEEILSGNIIHVIVVLPGLKQNLGAQNC